MTRPRGRRPGRTRREAVARVGTRPRGAGGARGRRPGDNMDIFNFNDAFGKIFSNNVLVFISCVDRASVPRPGIPNEAPDY